MDTPAEYAQRMMDMGIEEWTFWEQSRDLPAFSFEYRLSVVEHMAALLEQTA
jgi:hypothetical protein